MTGKEKPEKACEQCGSTNAVVHLTQVVDDQVTTTHLCEACAAKKGLQTHFPAGNLPLADFLANMETVPANSSGGPEEDLACPFCDLTARGFKEAGRLGCPQCYSTFEGHLRSLLRRIHGGTQHVGKIYLPPDPSVTEKEQQLDGLRRKLTRAVETEDFERAAELRDQIRALEPAG